MAEGLYKRFQSEVAKFKEIEQDKERTMRSRQQLESQKTENALVKEELDLLEADSNVYKLIGPVLVKQDLTEAKQNVAKRIEYINAEIDRHEASLTDMEQKMESQKDGVMKLQQQLQQVQVKAAMKAP